MNPINGQPVDLAQLRQPGAAELLDGLARMLAAAAGIELGGSAQLVTPLGTLLVEDVQIPVAAAPTGVTVFGVSGVLAGKRVLVPWASIGRMGPA